MVIFGFGNPGRGDDALGLALLQRLARQSQRQDALACCRLVEAIQLQIEHALDLVDQDLALFVDASIAGRAPYSFRRLHAQRDVSYTSHAMSPTALLQVYETISSRSAPPAYQLAIRGKSFELDAPLSEQAERHLGAAYPFVVHLCRAPDAVLWEMQTDENSA
ncbi:MAG: hydrogenase maturation protease [Gammaproteobacteria bacterium]